MYVVTRVLANSQAQKDGLNVGDCVLEKFVDVNVEDDHSEWYSLIEDASICFYRVLLDHSKGGLNRKKGQGESRESIHESSTDQADRAKDKFAERFASKLVAEVILMLLLPFISTLVTCFFPSMIGLNLWQSVVTSLGLFVLVPRAMCMESHYQLELMKSMDTEAREVEVSKCGKCGCMGQIAVRKLVEKKKTETVDPTHSDVDEYFLKCRNCVRRESTFVGLVKEDFLPVPNMIRKGIGYIEDFLPVPNMVRELIGYMDKDVVVKPTTLKYTFSKLELLDAISDGTVVGSLFFMNAGLKQRFALSFGQGPLILVAPIVSTIGLTGIMLGQLIFGALMQYNVLLQNIGRLDTSDAEASDAKASDAEVGVLADMAGFGVLADSFDSLAAGPEADIARLRNNAWAAIGRIFGEGAPQLWLQVSLAMSKMSLGEPVSGILLSIFITFLSTSKKITDVGLVLLKVWEPDRYALAVFPEILRNFSSRMARILAQNADDCRYIHGCFVNAIALQYAVENGKGININDFRRFIEIVEKVSDEQWPVSDEELPKIAKNLSRKFAKYETTPHVKNMGKVFVALTCILLLLTLVRIIMMSICPEHVFGFITMCVTFEKHEV